MSNFKLFIGKRQTMKHYFHRFATEADFNTEYNGSDYEEPWVSAINNANARTSEDFKPAYNK